MFKLFRRPRPQRESEEAAAPLERSRTNESGSAILFSTHHQENITINASSIQNIRYLMRFTPIKVFLPNGDCQVIHVNAKTTAGEVCMKVVNGTFLLCCKVL